MNDVAAVLAAVFPGMRQLLHESQAKKYTQCVTGDVANGFFSIPLAEEVRSQLPSPGMMGNIHSELAAARHGNTALSSATAIVHKTFIAATYKGMRGCHWLEEVMAFGAASENTQEKQWLPQTPE